MQRLVMEFADLISSMRAGCLALELEDHHMIQFKVAASVHIVFCAYLTDAETQYRRGARASFKAH